MSIGGLKGRAAPQPPPQEGGRFPDLRPDMVEDRFPLGWMAKLEKH